MASRHNLLKLLGFISSITLGAQSAAANDIRIGSATTVSKFDDLVYHHATAAFPAPSGGRGWRPDAWTAGIGVFQRDGDTATVYTFGPAWRLGGTQRYFLEAGFSLTYLGHRRFRDGADHREDFGQHLQFMSRLSAGLYLDRARQWSLEAGFMHVSNGGLSETNPGADFFSLDMQFAY